MVHLNENKISILYLFVFFFHILVPAYEVVNFRSMVRRSADQDVRHVDLSAFGTR